MRRVRLTPQQFMILVTVVLVVAGLLLLACIVQLGTGEVAVVVDPVFHTMSRPRAGPCIFFKAPWAYIIKDFYTIDYIEMSNREGADYPAINALTKDGVSILVEMTFTYSVDPSKFDIIARNYPRIDYEEQRLVPILRQIVRDVIAKYTVEEVITKRDNIAREIEQAYRDAIASDPTLTPIQLHQVNLRGIILPEAIQKAIEEKVAAYQRKIAAQYEAERIITLAQANATKIVISAEAQKNATILRAQATREALVLILNATGDPYVARLWMLQSIEGSNIIVIMAPNTNETYPLIIQPKQ